MEKSEFDRLMGECNEVAQSFDAGVAFIGGIAIYLHVASRAETINLTEFAHDASLYISLSDFSDLRSIEDVTANSRLNKHQMIKAGFEFDIYTERQSTLKVPYDELMAASKRIGDFNVASLEHLLVLKLEAFRDRCNSTKGDKDARDILRITEAAARQGGLDVEAIDFYLDDEHIKLLDRVGDRKYAMSLADGNSQIAKRIHQNFTRIADELRLEHNREGDGEEQKPEVSRP